MYHDTLVISIKGQQRAVPAIRDKDVVLAVTGKLLKIAQIYDEEWLERTKIPEPLGILTRLRSLPNRPDVYTFSQRLPDVTPRYPYHFEWENVAAATIESYRTWFDKTVDRSVRKHIRKSQREGIVAEVTSFDDKFVEGISSIYNELSIRQGRRFWHYGKSLEEVKRENATYLDRSIFIGAYYEEEIVGFLKFVIDGDVATMMQILSKANHFPKRPTNALISKAVEICELRGAKYLIYGKHTYGKKDESSLIDFKEKNGFRKIEFPKYYVPLTSKGHLALKLGLHKGIQNLLPNRLRASLVDLRAKYYSSSADRPEKID